MHDWFLEAFFWIFSGSTVLATLVLFTRQPLLIAYIALGVLLGPHVLNIFSDADLITNLSHVGIVFLLFLIGLDLRPRNILQSFKIAFWVVPLASLAICAVSIPLVYFFGMSWLEAAIVGLSFIYSSTIIGVKLLPTTVLHHKQTGELLVAILLVQDLMAIVALITINMMAGTQEAGHGMQIALFHEMPILTLVLGLPIVGLGAYYGAQWIIVRLIQRFERFQEFIFLSAIGWCLGIAQLANVVGLSYEIGAFVAGVSLTQSPISHYVVGALKPLRDFFLILFFFSLGAGFNLDMLQAVLWQSLVLAGLICALKPLIYALLLRWRGVKAYSSYELGFRLGQISEFSLLIAFLAFANAMISNETSHLIQLTTIFTFVISSYIVILRYPSPIAISDKLRRD